MTGIRLGRVSRTPASSLRNSRRLRFCRCCSRTTEGADTTPWVKLTALTNLIGFCENADMGESRVADNGAAVARTSSGL